MNEDMVERVAVALYVDEMPMLRKAESWEWIPSKYRPHYRRKALVALEAAGIVGDP